MQVLEEVLAGIRRGSCRGWKRFRTVLEQALAGVFGILVEIGKMFILVCHGSSSMGYIHAGFGGRAVTTQPLY